MKIELDDMPVDEFPVGPASSDNSIPTDPGSLFICRSSRTRGSLVTPTLSGGPHQLTLHTPVANTSPRGSLSNLLTHPVSPSSPPSTFLLSIASSTSCSPPPCPARMRKRVPTRNILPDVLCSQQCLYPPRRPSTLGHPLHGCSRCNSASGAIYRIIHRASHSFSSLPVGSRTCNLDLFYRICTHWCLLVC